MADFTLVVGNGITPNQDDFQALISRADFVIALDGAADKFEGWDIVVGDMDSIGNSQSKIADKCKNYSDLSKALSSYRVDAIIGIEGGRVDHRLQAFTSLIETKSDAILYFDGGRACFVPNSGLEINLEPGIKCGLFSFGITKSITLTGTKYALKNEDFFTGSKGVGNQVLSGPVIINHEGGDLIFTWQAN
ncbi:MAG TPA: hypothetical protein EYQ73_02560 [Candidatus Poseidoniales archaeon]|jgi:thiamine pyrophosphokinase|nr:MAG: hypothetical protein CXT71_03495 [Euryarchaeota archaeon]HIF45663.1 hypothetical protein [Candidatus Poseidoniales archaeon]HIL64891.1 hypothetical protein [Candidatus Poseidoniales archaeon]